MNTPSKFTMIATFDGPFILLYDRSKSSAPTNKITPTVGTTYWLDDFHSGSGYQKTMEERAYFDPVAKRDMVRTLVTVTAVDAAQPDQE